MVLSRRLGNSARKRSLALSLPFSRAYLLISARLVVLAFLAAGDESASSDTVLVTLSYSTLPRPDSSRLNEVLPARPEHHNPHDCYAIAVTKHFSGHSQSRW